MRVLIVEAEVDTLQLLTLYFEVRGYHVITARDEAVALQTFKAMPPDVVLLDIRIPHLDGWRLLKAIRDRSKVPVIILTASPTTDDVVKGLTLGADDYLRKPFQVSELEARIQAVLRRTRQGSAMHLLGAGSCQIDDRAKTVTLNGRAVRLSPKEYQLLKLLASDPGRVFSNEEIVRHLWSRGTEASANDVKQYIHLLRNKIKDDPTHPRCIETVKGFGYRLLT